MKSLQNVRWFGYTHGPGSPLTEQNCYDILMPYELIFDNNDWHFNPGLTCVN